MVFKKLFCGFFATTERKKEVVGQVLFTQPLTKQNADIPFQAYLAL
jgi:hypothetical protein